MRHGWLFEPHSTSSTGGTSAGGPQALRSALTQPAACAPTRAAEQGRASPLQLQQQRALPTPDAQQEREEQQTGAQEACAYILSPAPPPVADKARWPTGTPEPLDQMVEGPGLPSRQGLADPRLPSPSDALPAWLRTPAPDLVTGTSHRPTPTKTTTARGVCPVMRHAGAVVNAPGTGPRQLPQAAAEDALVEQDPGYSVGAVGVSVGVARRAIQPWAQAAWPRWTGPAGIRNMSEVRSANLVSST